MKFRPTLQISILAFILVALFGWTSPSLAQTTKPAPKGDPAKWKYDIANFEKQDQKTSPPKHGIVFVGSSTIRLWDTKKWFPDDAVINRGFGGSQTSDTLHYFDRIVAKHQPRLIVMYAGTNDISDGETPEQVFKDYRAIMIRMMKDLPKTELVLISIKPTVSRWKLWNTMNQTNQMLKGLCSIYSKWHFEDVSEHFLGNDGQPRIDLLSNDRLHLNESGYQVLTSIIEPHIARVIGGVEMYLPKQISSTVKDLEFFVRVHTQNESTQVEFRVDEGSWTSLKFDSGSNFKIWKGQLPNAIPAGKHIFHVRWKNESGRHQTAQRAFEVVE